jgi:hypothetical protein
MLMQAIILSSSPAKWGLQQFARVGNVNLKNGARFFDDV